MLSSGVTTTCIPLSDSAEKDLRYENVGVSSKIIFVPGNIPALKANKNDVSKAIVEKSLSVIKDSKDQVIYIAGSNTSDCVGSIVIARDQNSTRLTPNMATEAHLQREETFEDAVHLDVDVMEKTTEVKITDKELSDEEAVQQKADLLIETIRVGCVTYDRDLRHKDIIEKPYIVER